MGRRPTAFRRCALRSNRSPTSGGTVQYQVRTHGGLSITVLAPKTGRTARRSEAMSTSHGRRPRRSSSRRRPQTGGDLVMTDRHDGSSIDLEKELVRYMVEHRISRRYLLERIALVGGAAALAPIIAACTSSGWERDGSTRHRRPRRSPPSAAAPSASPSPTARALARRRAQHPQLDRLHRRRRSSRRSRTSTGSRSPRASSRPPTRCTPSSATTAAATTSASRSRSTSRT